jgi:hypothetical protein
MLSLITTTGISTHYIMSTTDPKSDNSPHSPQSAEHNRKRKRTEQPAATAQRASVNYIPRLARDASLSSSIDEEHDHVSTPPNPLRQVVEQSSRSGTASPRMIAAGELSKLSIDESITEELDEDITRRKEYSKSTGPNDSPRKKSSSPLADDDDQDEPSAKRVPRGIRSPPPKFRAFALPEKKPNSVSDHDRNEDAGSRSSGFAPSSTSPRTTISSEHVNSWDFDFSSMTWQDSEITGHLMLDSDDDGTGMNGIGFRPTPSIARQRAAQRRRQVHDWKMRQETEERERRAERRRIQAGGGFGLVSSGLSDPGVKKAVRFAV